MQKDRLKNQPHPHRIPLKRPISNSVRKERKPKEPKIKMLPEEDEGIQTE